MDDIGAAGLLAQNSSGAPMLKSSALAAGRAVGGLSAGVSRQVGEHELRALRLARSARAVAASSPGLSRRGDELKLLSQKFAGDIVVVDPRQRTGLAVVGGWQLQPRHR